MKKLMFVLTVLAFVAFPGKALAEDSVTICTQYYGGGVVCGVHTPIETGVAENIPLIGSLILSSSGIFFYLAKRSDKIKLNQNN